MTPHRFECIPCRDELDATLAEFNPADDCGGWTWDPPCGGCYRCAAGIVTHAQEQRHTFIHAAEEHGLRALHREPVELDWRTRTPAPYCSWHIGRECRA